MQLTGKIILRHSHRKTSETSKILTTTSMEELSEWNRWPQKFNKSLDQILEAAKSWRLGFRWYWLKIHVV